MIAETKRRRKLLNITKYSVYACIVLFSCLILSPIATHEDIYVKVFWASITIMMALSLVISMNRIDNFRSILFDEMTLQMNSEKLRRVHLGLFIFVAILLLFSVALEIADKILKDSYCDTREKNYYSSRLTVEKIKLGLEISIHCIWFFIIGTMVIMYIRYLAPLSSQQKITISERFINFFK